MTINQLLSSIFELNTVFQKEIGKRGPVVFYTRNELLLPDDSNRTIMFTKNIVDDKNKTYEISCGPWIETTYFAIFCQFDETFPEGEYFFEFNDTFNYSDYEINLLSNNTFNITKINSKMIDIYSPPQTINVTDNKNTYDLKFNILSYNQELIYIRDLWDEPLDCKKKNDKELICQVKKDLLESYNSNSSVTTQFPLIYLNDDGKGDVLFFVSSITINYNVAKKDIYVKITKLLTDSIDINGYFTYETNITNIPLVFADDFQLVFNGEKEEENLDCFFRKGRVGPLLILCKAKNAGKISLKEITNDFIVNDTNIKYNFIIKPVTINNNINVINKNLTFFILGMYPMTLDFTKKDYYYIDFFVNEGQYYTGITFNEDEEDLVCEQLKIIERCKVPKKHFKGKKDGYYYFHYFNTNLNKEVTSFYTGAITVITAKEEPDQNESNGSNITLIIIIILILFLLTIICAVFFILHRKKQKAFNKLMKDISFEKGDEQNLLSTV